jgi:PAS domain S-box-containing protein
LQAGLPLSLSVAAMISRRPTLHLMNKLLGARVLLGIGLVVLVIVGGIGISIYRTRQLHDDALWVSHTHEVIQNLTDTLSLLKDLETRQRGYIITGDGKFLQLYGEVGRQLDASLQEFRRLTVDNASQQQAAQELEQLVARRRTLIAANIALYDAQGVDAVGTTISEGTGKAAMDAVRDQVGRMIADERRLLAERRDAFTRQFRTAVITGMVVAAVGLTMVALFINLLRQTWDEREQAAAAIHDERERLKTTLASIGDGVIATDIAGQVTFLNSVAVELTGWTQADAAGRPLTVVFHIVNETTRNEVENPALRCLKEGAVVGLANHTVLIARDGRERAIADSAAPIRGRAGEMTGAVLVFRDVTEDRAAENALSASEARKAAILESALDAIISCDASGHVVEFNPAAERMFGYSREEVVKRELGELIVPFSLRQRHRDALQRLVETGEGSILGRRLEMSALRSDGTEFPVELAITKIEGAGPPLFTAHVREITERKAAQHALDERMRLLTLTAEVSRSLTRGDSLAVTLEGCAQALVSQLNGALARIWTYDDAEQLLELQAQAGDARRQNDPHGRVPLGKYKIGIIGATRKPHLSNDVTSDELFPDQEWVRRERLTAFAGYPLLIDDRLVGVVALYSQHTLGPETLDALAAVSLEIALGIDRGRAMRETREQHELLQVTLASIGDAVLTTDEEGRVRFLNDIAEGLTGWKLADAGGLPVETVFPIINETSKEPVPNPVRRVLAEGRIIGLANHTLLISQDGRQTPIDDSAAPIRNEQGRMVGTVLVFRDVTERRDTERRLREVSAQLETALTAGSIGTWAWNIIEDRTFGDANFARLFGLPAEVVAGGRQIEFLSAIHPDDREPVRLRVEEAIRTGQTYEAEFRIVHPKDGLRWLVARGVVDCDEEGRALRLNGVVVDITQRKRAEEELRALTEHSERQRRLYETILSATPDFVYVIDLEHRFTYVNPALLAMWGKAWETAVGRTFLQLGYEPWHAEMHNSEVDQVVSTKASIRNEVPFTGVYGTRIYDYIFSPVFDAQGNVEAVAGTTRDVTDRKQLEEHLRQVAAELSEANRRKNEFLATLAHELRNPLAPIRTGLELLKLGRDDPELVESTRAMMERQALHMVRLIDDLLDIARITQGKLQLRKANVAVGDIVRTSIESIRPFLEEKRHEFAVDLPSEPITLYADPSRLAQIVSNLLHNSVKYTPDGGRIQLVVEPEPQHVLIRVIDSGLGIPAEMRDRIFEMFAQIDRPMERGYTGLGIGLTLVKRIVEMHDGEISVVSAGEGQGSEFVIRLPLAKSPQPADGNTSGSENVEAIPSLRVLVVDDNREAADTLAAVLARMGHEVRLAHDGEQAVRAAEEFHPQVVFMDLGMPRLSGYEAAEQIRNRPWGKAIVLAALTGWGQEEDRRRTTNAGFDFHLIKPAEPDAVRRILQTAARR